MATKKSGSKKERIAAIIGDPFAEGIPVEEGAGQSTTNDAVGPEATNIEQAQRIPLSRLIDWENVREISRNLDELAQSMQSQGLVHPIVVRPDPEHPDMFDVIAGHRRVEGARLLGWEDIPATIRLSLTDEQCVELSVVENIERESMTPDEVGRGIKRMIDMSDGRLTQVSVARRLGKQPAYISGVLKLIEMPAEVQALVAEEKLKLGHIRVLLRLPEAKQISLARKAAANDIGVDELSEWVASELSNLQVTPSSEYEVREFAQAATQMVAPVFKEFPESALWRMTLFAALRSFNDYKFHLEHGTHYRRLWSYVEEISDEQVKLDLLELGRRYATNPLSMFAHEARFVDYLGQFEEDATESIPYEALVFAGAQEESERDIALEDEEELLPGEADPDGL